MQEDGWVLLDVRTADAFEAESIVGSVNVPLYGPVKGDGMYDNIKRIAMGALAMTATGAIAPHHGLSSPAWSEGRTGPVSTQWVCS